MAKIALVNFERYIDVKIGSLADSHIKRFGLRLAAGERGDPRVNPEQCQASSEMCSIGLRSKNRI